MSAEFKFSAACEVDRERHERTSMDSLLMSADACAAAAAETSAKEGMTLLFTEKNILTAHKTRPNNPSERVAACS